MNEKIARLLRLESAPLLAGIVAGALVLQIAVDLAILVTLVRREHYRGVSHVKLVEPKTSETFDGREFYSQILPREFELIRSEAILSGVMEQLELTSKWGEEYAGKEGRSKALKRLQRNLKLDSMRGTSLIIITAYGDTPREAAEIANSIADAYRGYVLLPSEAGGVTSAPSKMEVEVINYATTQNYPAPPNLSTNISLAFKIGGLLGLVIGGATFVSQLGRRRQSDQS